MAEPGRLPELLADFAPRHVGESAGRAVQRLRRRHPDASPAELRHRVVTVGNRAVSAQGAFVGGPFIVLVPFVFCAALLSQARMVLELASLEGRDPAAPERAAELLVLQGVYEDTETAAAALAAPRAPAGKRPGRITALWGLTMRMAKVLGVLTPSEDNPRLLVRLGQWALVGLVFLVGLVAPLVWLPYLAFCYHRNTIQLMDRATVFYAGERITRRPARINPATFLALVRALLSLLVPLVALVAVALTDARLADRQWPVLTITLFTTSVTVGGWWVWRRHKRGTGA
ncbi:hypothetical protein ACIGEZ_18745 [Streptomyces sp. NPDC085481]|uniref:hypothetical protein n=1 Tax=Streptomyces sp. NPDC085481 TaxID=3365727 RepID=UPI0037CEECCF